MGYASQTLSVAGRAEFDVVLKPDTQFLEEVVVVGYGTQKKVNLTGSVSMVDSEEMAARPISSLSSGLQGMLPGVTIVNSSGQPGASNTTIRVRGIGTIGNANPLILIDGVEGDISAINPEDIESVLNQHVFINESLVTEYDGHLVALVNFDMEAIKARYEELMEDWEEKKEEWSKIRDEIMEDIKQWINSKVNRNSRITEVVEEEDEFVKTPSKKIRRFLYDGRGKKKE